MAHILILENIDTLEECLPTLRTHMGTVEDIEKIPQSLWTLHQTAVMDQAEAIASAFENGFTATVMCGMVTELGNRIANL